MSVQSEIDRITQNVASTYAALSEMGATLPDVQNSDNLAATARTVSVGGTINSIAVANNTNDVLICGTTRVEPGDQTTVPLPEYGAGFLAFALLQSPMTEGVYIAISGPCYDWNEDAYKDIDIEELLFAEGSDYFNPSFVWNGSGVFLLDGATVEVNIAE